MSGRKSSSQAERRKRRDSVVDYLRWMAAQTRELAVEYERLADELEIDARRRREL